MPESPLDATPTTREIRSDRLAVEVDYDPSVYYALQQNTVPLVKALRVRNLTETEQEGLTLALWAGPDVAPRRETALPPIPPHTAHRLDTVELPPSGERLAGQTERERGQLWVELVRDGQPVLRASHPLEILAYGEWPGTRSLPEILAAFVLPNHPEVDRLLATAGRLLGERTGDPSLDGYQRRDPERVRAVVRAIYEALLELDLAYVVPPASFEVEGQKVRTPDAVVEARMGTCLDLALLFAALLEQAGLHPLVALFREHAVVGTWLEEECFVDAAVDEPIRLRKRIDLSSLCFVEPTGLTSRPRKAFDQAVEAANALVQEDDSFLYAVDVRAARRAGIRPLPARNADAQPLLEDAVEPEPPPASEKLSRAERWKRRLLDLSLRNRLLNYRPTKRTVRLRVPDAAGLEDRLAQGQAFRLLPEAADGTAPDDDTLRREMESGYLRTSLTDQDLERRLVTVYRAWRSGLQEGGANTLYLAIGFLRYFETPSSTTERLAPILLYPLTLTRRSIAEGTKGYVFELADDDPQVNVTLVQKLGADFDLQVGHLLELDEDENGLDVLRILERFREALKSMPRWDVVADTAVGLFSFTKHLMWRDLDQRTDQLTENAVVRHLLEHAGETFPAEGDFPDPSTFDATRPPTDTFVPLDADSSQLGAIFAAADGHTFVLEGPPGTGKSQTISNLICHALATGKRVLFVSEKMAALNVVHKRLAKVGLEPFCLELHSKKTRKRAVLEQLRAALDVAGQQRPESWPHVAERLGTAREGLNAHAEVLHRRRSFGESAFEGLARLMALRDVHRVTLDFGAPDAVDAAAKERLETLVREAVVALEDVGDVRDHAWRAARLEEWSPAVDAQVAALAPPLGEAAERLERASGAVARDVHVDPAGLSRRELEAVEEAGRLFADTPVPPEALLVEPAFETLRTRVDGWVTLGRRVREHEGALGARYAESLLDLDLLDLRRRLEASRKTFWPFTWLKARGPKKALRGVLKSGGLAKTEALLADLEAATDWRQRREELLASNEQAQALLGVHWDGLRTDWEALAGLLDWAQRWRELLAVLGARAGDTTKARWLELAREGRATFAADADGGRRHAELEDAREALDVAVAAVEEAFRLDPETAWGRPEDASYAARARSTAAAWGTHASKLRSFCAWVRSTRALEEAGLQPLLDALDAGQVRGSELEDAFARSFYGWWVEGLFEGEERLRRFRGTEANARVQDFRHLDEEVMETTRDVVRAHLAASLPSARAAAGSRSSSSEMGTLHRELMKRRNMPIRRLFERIPNVLSLIKPCMLMSPLSVAQYLGPDFPPFDLVVFDEASQIPPWDAVGAIARGQKLVVVGDSKQLPPTAFFQRADEGEENDEDDLQEMESILDECIAAGLPRLHLGWHYRSRHESLIAFSNHNYYDDRLTTFPSAVHTSPHLGVKWHPVPGGVYDKGATRTNRGEAQALVSELVHRLQDAEGSQHTYGIVTFSMAQQGLVEDLLEEARVAHPDLEPHFDDSREEPVFVKNLENVQGDERDVILLSVCYGPDEQGRVSLNFGPLNREGGERRLNVAVTRSREQVLVFSTLRAEQIDLSRTQSTGARHLKAFLEYAEQGPAALGQALALPADAAGSAFEDEVRAALEAHGWELEPKVGCSAYRVDVGVKHPDEEGRFLTAVETDGTTYGRALTARDRHRTRPGVLKHLGWNHYRTWAIDWWHDPDGELQKLLQALDDARADVKAPPPPAPEPAPEPAADSEPAPSGRIARQTTSDDTPLGLRLGGTPYKRTRLRKRTGDPRRFYEDRMDRVVVQSIQEVVDTEAPVAIGLVARRLADEWGLKRLTSRLKDRVGGLVAQASNWRLSSTTARYLWRQDQDPAAYEAFRVPAVDATPVRRARHLPPEEVANAAAALLREHISIGAEDLARETARVFGYRRFTDKVREPMEAGVELLVQRGGALRDEDIVRLP